MDIERMQQLAGIRPTRSSLSEARAGESPPWDAWPVQEGKGLGLPQRGTPRFKQMLKKGVLDFSDMSGSPESFSHYGLMGNIGDIVAQILLEKKGVAWIRDPDGHFKKFKWQGGDFRKVLALAAGQVYMDFHNNLDAEDELRDEKLMWGKAGAMAEKASFTVKPVQGKTGAGYRITMSPTFQDINKKFGITALG
jgi:hypothetical protein